MRSVSIVIGSALLASLFATGAGAVSLTYCPSSAPEGYDPALHIRADTFDASSQAIYDRLVARRSGGAVVPSLAESWDVSKDGLQYIFHLRKGVTFQTTSFFTPSRELNADDVVFSLDRQQNPKQPYFAVAGGDWPYYNAMGMPALVKSVDKVDAATVRVRLTRPDAGFLADLTMDFASILSREYADALMKAKTPELLDAQPVGTGPFQFVSSSAEGTAYKANPAYWDGAPKIDDLAFKVVPDPKERLDRLQAGVCDVIAATDAAGIATVEADPSLKVERTEAADIVYLAVNTTQKPFDDPRVRKALSLAIDRPAIVSAIYNGLAVPAATIVPDALQSYAAGPAPARDLDQARSLLQEAGVSDLNLAILTTPDARSNNPDPRRMARLIATDLASVGVTATVDAPSSLGQFLRQSVDKTRSSAVLFGWSGGNGDPVDFLAMMLSCKAVEASNRARWCDEDFDKLIDQGMAESDVGARAVIVSGAESMAASALPLIPIVHTNVVVPMKKTIGGVLADPFGRHNFARARFR